MIEIISNFLNLIADVINKIFFIEIELSNDLTAYLGVLMIAIVSFVLLMWFVLEITGINDVLSRLIGGDE